MNNNLLLILAFLPALSLVFVYTKANIWSFIIGISLCLIGEISLLCCYCCIKLQRAHHDSSSIHITTSNSLCPTDYMFQERIVNGQVYLNRYTEQARVSNKKKALKLTKLQNIPQQQQGVAINESPRAETLHFLQRIRSIYTVLNRFNHSLIQFGHRLTGINQKSFLGDSVFFFAKFEQDCDGGLPLEQIKQDEQEVFTASNIRLHLQDDGGIGLPSWQSIIDSLQFIGGSFKQIEAIRASNGQMLQMIHQKMMEDYEFLVRELEQVNRGLEQTRDNLESLRHEQEKLQKHQTTQTNESSIDMIYWLKKQFYEFTNLELRIKQNQKNYKVLSEKMKYYKGKLSTFCSENKRKYSKVLQTRYIAFLDSYDITVTESLAKIRSLFQQKINKILSRPPKVNKMIQSKNMNEVIAAERTYQEEYFRRVEYFISKLNNLAKSIPTIDQFLRKLMLAFMSIIQTLQASKKEQDKQNSASFSKLYRQLEAQCSKIYDEISALRAANNKLKEWNQPVWAHIRSEMDNTMQRWEQILGDLDLNRGPIQQRYRLLKTQLEMYNKSLEHNISQIQHFESLYTLHSNRIKKIIVVSLMVFLSSQKKYLNFGKLEDKHEDNQSDSVPDSHNPIEQGLPEELEEMELDKIDNLDSGYFLSEEYRRLINRFFFAAFTEWKDSQFFKQTLSREVYILLNEDYNESFSEIILQDFNLSGFPPEVVWVKQLKSDDNQFLADLNLAFRGKISLKITTNIRTVINLSLELDIDVEQFYCVLRICFVNSELGRSWFSFIGEPVPKFSIKPKIGNYPLDMQTIKTMLHNVLLKKLRRSIYPIREKIEIPLSKKDNMFEAIQKRYKAMRKDVYE